MEALFLEEVKAIAAGRRGSRSDSLATPVVDASADKTQTLPSPRSRTKVKKRSSLEFLNDASAASAKNGGSSSKGRRILVAPSTTKITPSSTSAAVQSQISPKQKQHNTSRRMSPLSKSKLDSLVSPSKKKGLSSEGGGRSDNNKGSKGKKNPISDKNNNDYTQHGALKNKNVKKSAQKGHSSSPQVSYSPLDYRPPSNIHNNNNNKSIQDHDDINNQMLETYVEQWTKPSPTDHNKKEEESNNNNDDDVDDPSSASVISTSSNSTNEEEEGGEEYKSMDKVKKRLSPNQQQQLIPSKSKHDSDSNRDTSQHVLSPPISLKLDPKLELEYGKLAFMKKELEHKMQMHQNLDTSTTDCSIVNKKTKPLFTLGNDSRSTTTTAVKSDAGDGSLELEYGKLAFMKQEIEHKMKLHKMDAEKINPWPLPATYHHPPSSTPAAADKGGIKYDEAAQTQSALTRRMEDDNDIPSRQDVAFGEMAYQRMVGKQRRMKPHHYLDGEDDNDVATKYKERQYRERHSTSHHNRESRNTDDDYSSVEYDHEYHIDRPKKAKKKKKKKRKRRMVETITRVIHEESEEEGSSSTGNHHRGHYYETKRPRLDYGRAQGSFTPERKGRVSKAYESEGDEFSQSEAGDHAGHGRSKQTRREKPQKEAAYYPTASRRVTTHLKKSRSPKRQQKKSKRGRLSTSSMLETLH